ncbi:MAG: trimethylamine methyltransferase family protein [Thermoplasmata archaeon]
MIRKRMTDKLRILSDDQVRSIHEASLKVLEKTGIKFWDRATIEVLKRAGAEVDWDKSIVRFPRDLIVSSMGKAPKRITLAGRAPMFDLKLDGEKSFFGTLGTAPLVFDLDTGERRYALKNDLEAFARITNALESVRYFHTSVAPSDVAPPVADLYRWATALRNTEKHLMGGAVYNMDNMPFLIDMCLEVAGGEKELKRRPMLTATECPVPPLQHDRRPLKGITEFARHWLPVIIYSEPKAGATSPASLAGTLVVSNAEVLSGITITQLINPGAPVIYGSVATLMDMRTGSIAFGSPETGILAAATTQMARHYGIPNMTPGGRTDSKMPDVQAGYEKQRTALMAGLAGASLSNMAGLLESNLVASYEQLIIDDEIIGTTERILGGIDFDADSLALDLIDKVGPGGTYLAQRHTMDRFRKEHYVPRVSDRSYYAGWVRSGSKQLREVARMKAKRILRESHPEPLDRGVDSRLSEILRDAEKRSMGKK